MLEILKNSPDKLFEIKDDNSAKMLLLELGLSGMFSQNPPGISKGTPSVQTGFYTEHATHFILAMLNLGFQNAEENGYIIACFPKSKMSRAEFDKFLQQTLKKISDQIPPVQRLPRESSSN